MAKTTMQRFLATYRLELWLTVRHWAYLILLVLWSGFIAATYINDDLFSLRPMFNFTLGFSTLFGLVLTGLVAMRPRRNRFDHLESAFPTGAEILFARWLATITALVGFLIVPLGIALFSPAAQMERLSYVVHILLLHLLAFGFITGLIWLVENTIGVRRWMHPFFAGIWLLGGLIPGIFNNDGLQFPGMNLFTFVLMDAPMNSLWDMLRGMLPVWFPLFYVGLIMLFAGVMLWQHHRQRFYHRHTGAIMLAVAALGLIIVSGANYTAEVAAYNQQVRTDRERTRVQVPEVTTPVDLPFAVTEYALTYTHGDPAELNASMVVRNHSDTALDELQFSLHYQFDVVDASHSFERDDFFLTLTLSEPLAPDEEASINIQYQGAIWVLEASPGRPPQARNFTHADGVYLTYDMLWYPVPGNHSPNFTVYEETGQSIVDYNLLAAPAQFRLEIAEPGQLEYTTNLVRQDDRTFSSSGARWVDLIGVPDLSTTQENGITLVADAYGYEPLEELSQQVFSPLLGYLREHFSDDLTLKLQVLDTPAIKLNYPATEENLIVRLSPRSLSWVITYPENAYRYGGENLFISLFGGHQSLLTQNIAYFLWVHYSTGGDKVEMESIIREATPPGNMRFYSHQTLEERFQIANVLLDVYLTQGEDAVFDVLQEIRQEIDSLADQPADVMIGWIEDRANDE